MEVVIILFSLSSIIALLLAAIALGQSARAGRNAAAAKRSTIGDDEKRKLVELSGKMAAIEPRFGELGQRVNEVVERLGKLESALSGRGDESKDVKLEMQKTATELMGIGLRVEKFAGDIEDLKQFKNTTEEVHRRIVSVFSEKEVEQKVEVEDEPHLEEIVTEPKEISSKYEEGNMNLEEGQGDAQGDSEDDTDWRTDQPSM